MNNPVCLSQNKPVGEGSPSEPGRLEQRGAQPLVISPGSGSSARLDPQPLAQYTLPSCLPDCLTDLTDWLSLTPLLLTLSPSLSCSLTPLLLLSTLDSESTQIGKVLLRPASGQLEDGTERIFTLLSFALSSSLSLSSILPKSAWMDFFAFCWRHKNKS